MPVWADASLPPTAIGPDCATARADLRRAEAELFAATRNLERMKQLLAVCGPKRDLDQAQEAAHTARADRDRARANYAARCPRR